MNIKRALTIFNKYNFRGCSNWHLSHDEWEGIEYHWIVRKKFNKNGGFWGGTPMSFGIDMYDEYAAIAIAEKLLREYGVKK